jgi:hypothetical protein
MANTIVNGEHFAQETQVFLRSMLVTMDIATTRFESVITPGQQIHLPYAATARVQSYTFSTDATIDAAEFTDDVLTVSQKKIVTLNYDPMQNLQAHQESWQGMLTQECSYQLSRAMDQHGLETGVDGAANTVAVGGSLTVSNVAEQFTSVDTTLARARAGAGVKFAVVEPMVAGILARADIANGFNRADSALSNGYIGDSNYGFRIYESNDLPCTVALTVDTQPANLDTFTIYGKTWTCVTDGTAAVAGEINIGANLADFQAIFLTAIAGTTPPSASDYIDLSTDDRREYINSGLAASAWAANVVTLTGYGRIGGSETFTTVTNVFGDETCEMLFGHIGALDFVAQQSPNVLETQEPKNLSRNILVTALYQAKVFTRNASRLVKLTATI